MPEPPRHGLSPGPSPTSALSPGTARWAVLAALSTQQAYWTAPQLVGHTGLALDTVLRALDWLRQAHLLRLVNWARMDTLYEVTDAGRDTLRQGAQLALELG